MTREEAKQVFLNRGMIEVDGGSIFDGNKWREACRVISEWLEQEPCDDCVNRQSVVDFLADHAKDFDDAKVRMCFRTASSLVGNHDNIPSVTPTRKVGKWIKHDTGHSIYYDCYICGCAAPCTETADKILWKLSNYCPDCGAKMESENG